MILQEGMVHNCPFLTQPREDSTVPGGLPTEVSFCPLSRQRQRDSWLCVGGSEWTLQSEIDSIHKKLSILQEDDEFDETLEVPALPAHTSNGRGRARRPKSYKEADDEDDEVPVIRIGGRVERFVKKRTRHLREISEVSHARVDCSTSS